MKENEIDRILAELFAGENISEEDRHVLEEWKRENGRNERFEEELQDLKEFSMGLKGRRDNRGVFEQIEKIVKKQREKFLLVRWSVVAAGIVLLLGFASYFMLSSGEREVETLRLANNVKVGTSKAELVLPRGQVIQLDSSSRDILFSGDQVKASSAKNTLVYAVGIDSEIVDQKGPVQSRQEPLRTLRLRTDDDPVGRHEILDRRSLFQEFRVTGYIEGYIRPTLI